MSAPETFLDGRVTLWCGDMRDALARLEENSVDSCVTDPPYHLHSIVKRFAKAGRTDKTRTSSGPHQRTATGFMNRTWDGGDIAFQVETWSEVLRVLKPGGYIVAFSSSRTFGRMSVAIEDAGFITHPLIGWIFAQGFPKAHRVHLEGHEGWRYGGQALKPALEPIYVGQKPFSEINGTKNVGRWGTGALNIDGCRVATDGESPSAVRREAAARSGNFGRLGYKTNGEIGKFRANGDREARLANYLANKDGDKLGRWPANLMTDGSPAVFAAFPDSDGQQYAVGPEHGDRETVNCYGDYGPRPEVPPRGDTGSAARFFWSSKAGTDDRLGSSHPTVKPIDLIQELVRLVTPPKGIVLDCFAGTGTTGEAAYREGFSAILIEREPEYQADIRRRMKLVLAGPDERLHATIKARGLVQDAGPLFGGSDEKTPGGGRQIYGHFADQDERLARSASSGE